MPSASWAFCSTINIVVPGLAVDLPEAVEQVLDDDRRETERRLVEQHHLGPRHQGPRHRQHLLLAAREAAGALVASFVQHGIDLEPLRHVGVDLLVLADEGTDTQVVLDGEFGERAASLRDVLEAPPHDVGRALADELLAAQLDAARGLDHARHRPQRGGLAGTVGTEDHDDLAVVDMEVEPVQHLDRPVPAAQGLDVEQRRRRGCAGCRRRGRVGHAGAPR